MLHHKAKSPTSTLPFAPEGHTDPSSERLGSVFVFAAISGADFVDDEHEPTPDEEPIVEASYPTSWTWMGRPGDHRP